MTTTLKAMAAVAILAAASPASASDVGTGRLVWDCGRAGAPSFEELRSSFGVANFHLASQTRIRLASRLAAACQRGVEQVILVEVAPVDDDAARLAAR